MQVVCYPVQVYFAGFADFAAPPIGTAGPGVFPGSGVAREPAGEPATSVSVGVQTNEGDGDGLAGAARRRSRRRRRHGAKAAACAPKAGTCGPVDSDASGPVAPGSDDGYDAAISSTCSGGAGGSARRSRRAPLGRARGYGSGDASDTSLPSSAPSGSRAGSGRTRRGTRGRTERPSQQRYRQNRRRGEETPPRDSRGADQAVSGRTAPPQAGVDGAGGPWGGRVLRDEWRGNARRAAATPACFRLATPSPRGSPARGEPILGSLCAVAAAGASQTVMDFTASGEPSLGSRGADDPACARSVVCAGVPLLRSALAWRACAAIAAEARLRAQRAAAETAILEVSEDRCGEPSPGSRDAGAAADSAPDVGASAGTLCA